MSSPEPEEAFHELLVDAVLTLFCFIGMAFIVALVLCPSAFGIAR